MKHSFYIYLALIIASFVSCKEQKTLPLLDREVFQTEINGKKTDLYTLQAGDLTMQVTNLGGRVVALWTPDKNGKMEDIVLGHNTIEQYVNYKGERFLGCVVGRFANRIANGRFSLNGLTYQLPVNNNGQTLHGGLKGLDLVVWDIVEVSKDAITLGYTSPDGEEGFPGTLQIEMKYRLTRDNEFIVSYSANTDNPTVINLSHHSFFNLRGEANGTITDHVLQINSQAIIPVDSVLIPLDTILVVDDSPFDFRNPTPIGLRLSDTHQQLKNGLGYDHNWILDKTGRENIELAASVYEPISGRLMEVWTDQPGLQFYSGNFMDGVGEGKYGNKHNYRESFALETQHFPDSPNRPDYPSTILNPHETYTHTCVYKFKVQ